MERERRNNKTRQPNPDWLKVRSFHRKENVSLDLHVEQGYLPITFTFYEVAKKVQAFKQPLGK